MTEEQFDELRPSAFAIADGKERKQKRAERGAPIPFDVDRLNPGGAVAVG